MSATKPTRVVKEPAEITDVVTGPDGRMTAIRLNTGRTLGGIIGGKLSVNAQGIAVVTLSIMCKPALNGKPMPTPSGLVAPDGRPLVTP